MRQRGVGADHQIEIFHDGGGIQKCVRPVIKAAILFHRHARRQAFQLLGARVFLQVDQTHAVNPGDGLERRDGKGLAFRSLDGGIALPGNADAPAMASDPAGPIADPFRLGCELRFRMRWI